MSKDQAAELLSATLQRLGPLIVFNDTPGRTFEEVVEVLKKAGAEEAPSS